MKEAEIAAWVIFWSKRGSTGGRGRRGESTQGGIVYRFHQSSEVSAGRRGDASLCTSCTWPRQRDFVVRALRRHDRRVLWFVG